MKNNLIQMAIDKAKKRETVNQNRKLDFINEIKRCLDAFHNWNNFNFVNSNHFFEMFKDQKKILDLRIKESVIGEINVIVWYKTDPSWDVDKVVFQKKTELLCITKIEDIEKTIIEAMSYHISPEIPQNICRLDDLAKLLSAESNKHNAWIAFGILNNKLVARGNVTGFHSDEWIEPTFTIPYHYMKQIVNHFDKENK